MCPVDKYIIQTYNYVNELFQYIGYIQAQPLQRVEKSSVPQISKYTSKLFLIFFLIGLFSFVPRLHAVTLRIWDGCLPLR